MYICKVVGMAAAVSTFAMVLSAAAICPTTSNNNTGADPTGCGVLITYPANGNPVVAITGTGAYDGSDDTTVGIINNTTSAITSISLNATDASDAFGFEGDGIQTYASDIQNGVPVGSGGATGYEGPNSTFNLSGVDSSGGGTLVVNFSGSGITPGGTAYFSLEGDPSTAGGGIVVGPSVPEPSTYGLLATGILGVFGLVRRRQKHS